MNVFEFRQNLVNEYAEFTRSFTRIKADDIRAYVDAEYASQKYWPEPLVQINPNFQPGGTVESLCAAGDGPRLPKQNLPRAQGQRAARVWRVPDAVVGVGGVGQIGGLNGVG